MANPNNYLTGQTLVDKVRTISSVDEFDNDRNKGLRTAVNILRLLYQNKKPLKHKEISEEVITWTPTQRRRILEEMIRGGIVNSQGGDYKNLDITRGRWRVFDRIYMLTKKGKEVAQEVGKYLKSIEGYTEAYGEF